MQGDAARRVSTKENHPIIRCHKGIGNRTAVETRRAASHGTNTIHKGKKPIGRMKGYGTAYQDTPCAQNHPKVIPKSPLLPTFSLSIHKDLVGRRWEAGTNLEGLWMPTYTIFKEKMNEKQREFVYFAEA